MRNRSSSRSTLQGQGACQLDLFLLCLTCILSGGYAFKDTLCEDGWTFNSRNGKCLKVVDIHSIWDSARTKCRSLQADLVTILDFTENKFIQDFLKKQDMEEFWIGLHSNNKNNFLWVNSDPNYTYTNWDEKNTLGVNMCVVFSRNTGFWQCRKCSEIKPMICEKESALICPLGWTQCDASRVCIRAFQEDVTWEEARARCLGHGGDLLSILDADVQSFVKGLVNSSNIPYWIGLNDNHTEGYFTWLDGYEKATYKFWSPQAKVNTENRDCVLMNLNSHGGDHGWSVEDCSQSSAGYICELFTDCSKHRFGIGCYRREPCSDNCVGTYETCSRRTGVCYSGCKPGFLGDSCEVECETNKFGQDCSQHCNVSCGGTSDRCDSRTGECTYGCDYGFKGKMCDLECEPFTYGRECSKNCSMNCKNPDEPCNVTTGRCPWGCQDGYIGDRCEQECYPYYYGKDCLQKCSPYCAGPGKLCNRTNGVCLDGCDEDYEGPKCDALSGRRISMYYASISLVVLFAITLGAMLYIFYMQTSRDDSDDTELSSISTKDQTLSVDLASVAGSLNKTKRTKNRKKKKKKKQKKKKKKKKSVTTKSAVGRQLESEVDPVTEKPPSPNSQRQSKNGENRSIIRSSSGQVQSSHAELPRPVTKFSSAQVQSSHAELPRPLTSSIV